jgi:hypothetical protein
MPNLARLPFCSLRLVLLAALFRLVELGIIRLSSPCWRTASKEVFTSSLIEQGYADNSYESVG